MKKEELNKLTNEVSNLKETMDIFQQNINNNIGWFLNWFLGGLAIIIAIVGAALVLLVKYLVEKRVDKEIETLNSRIKAYLQENPQLLWARGSGVLVSSNVIDEGNFQHEYFLSGLKDFKLDNLVYLDAHYFMNGQKIPIDERNIHYSNDGVRVVVNTTAGFSSNIPIQAFVLWMNPVYQKK